MRSVASSRTQSAAMPQANERLDSAHKLDSITHLPRAQEIQMGQFRAGSPPVGPHRLAPLRRCKFDLASVPCAAL